MKKASEPLKTALTICMGLVVLYTLKRSDWILLATLAVGVSALLSARLACYIDKGWMKLAHLLGLVVPNILLGVVFYFLLFPVALVSRLFGNKDPLNLRNRLDSTFVDYRKKFTKESFEKYW